ncbi:MAG: PAS domain-containing protein [Spirochaetes bacterium]|nr:PAS domain-containing protein [Spirochaetota bacterium]
MIVKKMYALLAVVPALMLLSACQNEGGRETSDWHPPTPYPFFSFYLNIPGVSSDEVENIENLRWAVDYFVLGSLHSVEAFVGADGNVQGFSALLAQRLTELFDIPFVPRIFSQEDLTAGLADGSIDFALKLSSVEGFITSAPITSHQVMYFRLAGSPPLPPILLNVAQGQSPRFAFVPETGILEYVRSNVTWPFEVVYTANYDEAYILLTGGEVDAIVSKNLNYTLVDSYGNIQASNFFPLIFVNGVIATGNPNLATLVDVAGRTIEIAGLAHIRYLAAEGQRDFNRHVLYNRLTQEERDFLRYTSVIPLATEANNYPVSFFDRQTNTWQGIGIDILREVEALTGLGFDVIHGADVHWHDVQDMLERGDALITTELFVAQERQDSFLWAATPTTGIQPLLLVRRYSPHVSVSDIYSLTIGVRNDTSRFSFLPLLLAGYHQLIPMEDPFSALLDGQVDMVLTTSTSLTRVLNLDELHGFQINSIFPTLFESRFGYHRQAEILASIVDKAMVFVDVELVIANWENNVHRHSVILAEARTRLMATIAGAISFLLLGAIAVAILNAKKKRIIESQAVTLSTIYNSIPAMVYTKNLQNEYTSINSQVEKELMVSRTEVVGQTLEAINGFFQQAVVKDLSQADMWVAHSGITDRAEGWYDLPGNPNRAKEFYRAPLVQKGIITGTLGMIFDITERKLAEETAQRAHEQVRSIFESIPVACILLRKKVDSTSFSKNALSFNFTSSMLEVIDCNKEALRLTERSSKGDLSRYFMDLLPPYQKDGEASHRLVMEHSDKALNDGKSFFEASLQIPGGGTFPAAVTFVRIDYMGSDCILSTIHDLSEIKRISTRIETIMSNLAGMVFQYYCDPPYFTFTYVSGGAKELTGYATYELLGKSSLKLLEASRDDETVPFADYLASSYSQDILLESNFRIRTKNGSEKWVWTRSRVIEKTIDGRPYLIEGYMLDITEKHRLEVAEDEKERLNARLQGIIVNMPGMAFQRQHLPPFYPLVYVSEGSKELLGMEPYEMIDGHSNKFLEAVHPEDRLMISKNWEETLEAGLPSETSYRIVLKDGTVKWVHTRSRVLEYSADGKPSLVEGYCFDISERFKAQSAEAANKAKSDFLAIMSHEIRTPMNSIMGFAELAMDSNDLPKVKSFMKKISSSSKWLLNILNDILDISKIESGKMDLEAVPFSMNEIFMRCQSVLLPSIKEKDIHLRTYLDPNLADSRLIGDPVRVYQILINLLSNAVKFTPAGVIKFSAAIKNRSASSVSVYFEVADQGIGINEEQAKKIFEPFSQADSSTTRHYGGTGLGLAITKSLIEMMGGTIKLESSPDVGSTFSFEVEFQATEAKPDSGNVANKKTSKKPQFDNLILVCEDNPMNQEVIIEHLARLGLKPVIAENGQEGVDTVRERMEKGEKPFDLIFMDIFMPVMDGLNAAAKIIELGVPTPIIAMTANIMSGELEKYKKAGMPDCIGKPFTAKELLNTLLKYLVPVAESPPSENGEEQKSKEPEISNDPIKMKVMAAFLKNNRNKFAEITSNIEDGDLKTAHRLIHSLRTNAAFIGKTALQKASAQAEDLLSGKEAAADIQDSAVFAESLKVLGYELSEVLQELTMLFPENSDKRRAHLPPDSPFAVELFEKLEKMLENINPEVASLVDDLKSVEGTEEIVQQIENYEFEAANAALADLKLKSSQL